MKNEIDTNGYSEQSGLHWVSDVIGTESLIKYWPRVSCCTVNLAAVVLRLFNFV